jgi:adenine deaminase
LTASAVKNDLKRRIAVARGEEKADLVLRGGSLVNVFSGEIYRTDVAVCGGKIAGLGSYEGRRVIEVSSKFILPGFIDSHVHIESSMLTPPEFARAALPHGTTAVIADPHEIANVLGKAGVKYMLSASEGLPLDFYFMLPSCVPTSSLETSGARLRAADLLPLLKQERVLGLAEMMNYPGVLNGEPSVLRMLKAFSHTLIDGHAPGLSDHDLSAYAGAGISSDHECTTADEAQRKVRLGMTVFMREGSAAKDLEALLPAVTRTNARFFTLATDDVQPNDLQRGGINGLIKKTIRFGLDPVVAVQMATINAARHFGLRQKGAVLPGYDADLVVIDDLQNFAVEKVFKAGTLVAEGGTCIATIRSSHHERARGTVRTGPIEKQEIMVKARTGLARVIELIPDQIETKCSILPMTVKGGSVVSDIHTDILKLVVIERHKATGNRGVGLVKGFGFKAGAIAGTVAHDSHNIIATGTTDEDILAAVSRVQKIQGGLVVVGNRKVIAEISLPVAGLMSDKRLDVVVDDLAAIDRAVRGLGTTLEHPFGKLSFLALPVIPELKLTDRGLVDVKQFKFVDLFV